MARPERRAFRTVIGRVNAPKFVEDSLVLSIEQVIGKPAGSSVSLKTVVLTWSHALPFQGPVTATVDLHKPANAWVRLDYVIDGVEMNYRVRLEHTQKPIRWWFVCPLDDIRVANLYLPAGARRFASRKAHRLVYKCQAQKKLLGQLSSGQVRLMQRMRGKP